MTDSTALEQVEGIEQFMVNRVICFVGTSITHFRVPLDTAFNASKGSSEETRPATVIKNNTNITTHTQPNTPVPLPLLDTSSVYPHYRLFDATAKSLIVSGKPAAVPSIQQIP